MKKKLETFRDEHGELCRYATRGECLLFSLLCWMGLIGFIGLCILSRSLYAWMCSGLLGN